MIWYFHLAFDIRINTMNVTKRRTILLFMIAFTKVRKNQHGLLVIKHD